MFANLDAVGFVLHEERLAVAARRREAAEAEHASMERLSLSRSARAMLACFLVALAAHVAPSTRNTLAAD